MTLLRLLAFWVWAASAAAPAPVPDVPALPQAAAAPELSAHGAPASPLITPAPDALWLSRDVARNERLRQLADAGAREFLAERGLLLWQIVPFIGGGRDRLELRLSLFDGAAPEGAHADAVAEHGDAVREFAARATGLSPDDVLVGSRPMKTCCGSGCSECLHSKKGPSRYWTRPPREK